MGRILARGLTVAAGLTATTFQISETDGGTPLTLTASITSASMQVVPETTDTDTFGSAYSDITDPTDVQAPPAPPPAPTAPTVDSILVSGIVRLRITLNSTPEVKVRLFEAQVTHKYDSSCNPDWTAPIIENLP